MLVEGDISLFLNALFALPEGAPQYITEYGKEEHKRDHWENVNACNGREIVNELHGLFGLSQVR
jgi:hypothetical protein